MTESTGPIDRRAQNVAFAGFFLQLVMFLLLLGAASWASSDVLAAGTRFAAVGLPIWFVLWLMFKQIRRVGTEVLEIEELRRARAAGTDSALFEAEDEELLLEQNRLQWMVHWILPSVTVLLAVYLLGGQFVGWGWTLDNAFTGEGISAAREPTFTMWFPVAVSFVCFLYARYTLALARMPEWRLLHAGASFMAATALMGLMMALSLMGGTQVAWAEPLVAYVIRAAMFVLGVELAANLVLERYRPRVAGQLSRPAFDSRLLGLITEPGGIARSIAEAINYQFGFEVSTTWFYRLLQRWLLPLVVVMLIAVFALSSLVVVEADEQVVIERFGQPLLEAGSSAESAPAATFGPGLHLKWPYPIDIVYRAPVSRLREVQIGEVDAEGEEAERAAREHRPLVWAEKHRFEPELMVLVASPQLVELTEEAPAAGVSDSGEPEDTPQVAKSVAVGLLMFGVRIHYRVKDLEAYIYNYEDPDAVLEEIAHQALSDFAAQRDVDELLGAARSEFNAGLRDLIQRRLDELDTGIEVAFAGTGSLHPPSDKEVATTFLKVISSETRMGAAINSAHGQARKILTEVAGTEARARRLDAGIKIWQRLSSDDNADLEEAAQARAEMDALMLGAPERGIAPMSGKAAALIADARAEASRQISRAATKNLMFSAQLAGYQASPTLFRIRKQLEIFEDLEQVRKYLFVGDVSNVIIQYDTGEQTGLDEILTKGIEERTR